MNTQNKITFIFDYRGEKWCMPMAILNEFKERGWETEIVPIPNGEVTLNGSDLVSQGQTEKGELITQLREFLEKLTKEQMLTRQNAEATQMMELLAKAPLRIYVG